MESPSRLGPIVVIGLIVFVAVPGLAGLYLDLRWFASVGFGEILRTQLLTQLSLFAGAAALAGGFVLTNLRLARRWSAGHQPLYLYDPDGLPRINLGAFVDRLVAPASGALAVLAGLMTYPRWQTWVLAANA